MFYQTNPNVPILKAKRAVFSEIYLKLLADGYVAINYDESVYDCSNYNRYTWAKMGKKSKQYHHKINPRLTIIAAVDSTGRLYTALQHNNSN
jgi:hypothetical protein